MAVWRRLGFTPLRVTAPQEDDRKPNHPGASRRQLRSIAFAGYTATT
jgi:hypothetical protein